LTSTLQPLTTATLTGLYAPQNNVVFFATSLGTVSITTDITSPDTATTLLTSNWTGTALVTVSAGYRNAATTVNFVHPTLDHFSFAPIGDQATGIDFTVTITAEDSSNQVRMGEAPALLGRIAYALAPLLS
jgi:hypothetical protein